MLETRLKHIKEDIPNVKLENSTVGCGEAGVGGFFGMGSSNAGIIGVECLIAALFWVIAYAVFNKGIQIYESAGN